MSLETFGNGCRTGTVRRITTAARRSTRRAHRKARSTRSEADRGLQVHTRFAPRIEVIRGGAKWFTAMVFAWCAKSRRRKRHKETSLRRQIHFITFAIAVFLVGLGSQ